MPAYVLFELWLWRQGWFRVPSLFWWVLLGGLRTLEVAALCCIAVVCVAAECKRCCRANGRRDLSAMRVFAAVLVVTLLDESLLYWGYVHNAARGAVGA